MIGETGSVGVGGIAAMPIEILKGIVRNSQKPPLIVAQILSLKEAATNGTPFCEKCTK
jgi:hypothetical protein